MVHDGWERDKELQQSPHRLDIGPSTLRASDCGLEIDIQERATPFGQRVVGRVSLSFERATDQCFELDGVGEHLWWPIAPIAEIDVAMERPGLRWSGAAYIDSNYGSRPIETGFVSWNWCRGHTLRVTVRFITMRSSAVVAKNIVALG